MKLSFIAFLIGCLVAIAAMGQTEEIVVLKTRTGDIEGTLMMPEAKLPVPVALIIAGSGPTDRDGNNPVMKNNSLKMLAEGLAKKGIATLRYDKRGIAKSQAAGLTEADLRFDHYIQDAREWIQLLKQNKNFNQVVVIGHSEGSLIGMVASQDEMTDKFISMAGTGRRADLLIRDQLKAQPAFVLEQSAPMLDELVQGRTVEKIPQGFEGLFRASVQPYLISWFKVNPQVEIARLKKPVLILQGTTDIQVSVEDAQMLQKAMPSARMVLIQGMNHILKNAEADPVKNMQTYSQPELPVNHELIDAISSFISSK